MYNIVLYVQNIKYSCCFFIIVSALYFFDSMFHKWYHDDFILHNLRCLNFTKKKVKQFVLDAARESSKFFVETHRFPVYLKFFCSLLFKVQLDISKDQNYLLTSLFEMLSPLKLTISKKIINSLQEPLVNTTSLQVILCNILGFFRCTSGYCAFRAHPPRSGQSCTQFE